jgi:hypothetical protein
MLRPLIGWDLPIVRLAGYDSTCHLLELVVERFVVQEDIGVAGPGALARALVE